MIQYPKRSELLDVLSGIHFKETFTLLPCVVPSGSSTVRRTVYAVLHPVYMYIYRIFLVSNFLHKMYIYNFNMIDETPKDIFVKSLFALSALVYLYRSVYALMEPQKTLQVFLRLLSSGSTQYSSITLKNSGELACRVACKARWITTWRQAHCVFSALHRPPLGGTSSRLAHFKSSLCVCMHYSAEDVDYWWLERSKALLWSACHDWLNADYDVRKGLLIDGNESSVRTSILTLLAVVAFRAKWFQASTMLTHKHHRICCSRGNDVRRRNLRRAPSKYLAANTRFTLMLRPEAPPSERAFCSCYHRCERAGTRIQSTAETSELALKAAPWGATRKRGRGFRKWFLAARE